MVKIKALVENWIRNEYDEEAITNEYSRLYNCFWALYENGLITREQRESELQKLNKTLDMISNQMTMKKVTVTK